MRIVESSIGLENDHVILKEDWGLSFWLLLFSTTTFSFQVSNKKIPITDFQIPRTCDQIAQSSVKKWKYCLFLSYRQSKVPLTVLCHNKEKQKIFTLGSWNQWMSGNWQPVIIFFLHYSAQTEWTRSTTRLQHVHFVNIYTNNDNII